MRKVNLQTKKVNLKKFSRIGTHWSDSNVQMGQNRIMCLFIRSDNKRMLKK